MTGLRCLGVLGILGGLAAPYAACAKEPRLPSAESLAQDVLSGRTDFENLDFAAAGYWALTPEDRLAWRSPLDLRIFGTQVTSQSCDEDERRRFAAAMWLQLLRESPDEATWSEIWRALRAALARHDADVRAAGDKVPAGKDARLTELSRRVARDQIIRDPASSARWSEGLPAAAQGPWFAHQLTRMVTIDCDDTEWLRVQLREIGWFDIPRFGEQADREAWLLVQHADRTPEFQREVLGRLKALPAGHTNPRNLAYLEDRVASAEKRPQRYGTQGQCAGDGSWTPHPIDEPEGVDARRAALGLEPMAEYAKHFVGLCPKLPPAPPPASAPVPADDK